MEPIPYFFESIDRNAILVRPKQPFYDWANAMFKDGKPINEKDECNIYLVHEKASNEEVMKWMRTHFDDIFMNELTTGVRTRVVGRRKGLTRYSRLGSMWKYIPWCWTWKMIR